MQSARKKKSTRKKSGKENKYLVYVSYRSIGAMLRHTYKIYLNRLSGRFAPLLHRQFKRFEIEN